MAPGVRGRVSLRDSEVLRSLAEATLEKAQGKGEKPFTIWGDAHELSKNVCTKRAAIANLDAVVKLPGLGRSARSGSAKHNGGSTLKAPRSSSVWEKHIAGFDGQNLRWPAVRVETQEGTGRNKRPLSCQEVVCKGGEKAKAHGLANSFWGCLAPSRNYFAKLWN